MAAVSLAQANQAYITLSPPWGKRLFKLGRLANPPGHMPKALERYATDAGFRNANLKKAQAVVKAHSTGASKRK